LENGEMNSSDIEIALAIASGDRSDEIATRILDLAKITSETAEASIIDDPWLAQLDWKPKRRIDRSIPTVKHSKTSPRSPPATKIQWPKWYFDLAKPKKDTPPGTVDITVRTRIAPILLRLSWLGWPLFHSREHGWTFRVPSTAEFSTRLTPVQFYDPADEKLQASRLHDGFVFYKLPHKDGEAANVGNPLAKTFMKYAQDGTLTSPGDEAKEALDMNAQCSYWISARDRILKQNIVWQDEQLDLGFKDVPAGKKRGIIIPQVITMGTVTRRAIEKTWLTASNAKKNRVGSELKAMVRAPDGYAIVGADVDSEELWISSCMGDAQFGLHGATAIGWMTLEGTKAAGTDLHSKTASILGISRDQAKVFNYSRIYGAGMRHAVLLLLQSNAGMLREEAQKLAENLYFSTKGKSTHRTDIFGRKFWFGGTESYLFNKLEEIALSDRPQTPALGCGVTDALSKEYLLPGFGTDYMTSRINWVVQSSGVDYLHLLIVSMDHLLAKYNIKARYLISVHDELRYLVKEKDKYRAALALQIANLWTRCLFAYKLGMDDLPQGVAFFSAVDVDKILRKEVDMPCVTPSHPNPIPSGESLNIMQVLAQTNGGSLRADGGPMAEENLAQWADNLQGYQAPDCLTHRANGAAFLRAQATTEFAEVKHLAQMQSDRKFEGGIWGPRKSRKHSTVIPKLLADVEGVDWNLVNEVLKSTKLPTTARH
jgi:DNA polymerase gamma 1